MASSSSTSLVYSVDLVNGDGAVSCERPMIPAPFFIDGVDFNQFSFETVERLPWGIEANKFAYYPAPGTALINMTMFADVSTNRPVLFVKFETSETSDEPLRTKVYFSSLVFGQTATDAAKMFPAVNCSAAGVGSRIPRLDADEPVKAPPPSCPGFPTGGSYSMLVSAVSSSRGNGTGPVIMTGTTFLEDGGAARYRQDAGNSINPFYSHLFGAAESPSSSALYAKFDLNDFTLPFRCQNPGWDERRVVSFNHDFSRFNLTGQTVFNGHPVLVWSFFSQTRDYYSNMTFMTSMITDRPVFMSTLNATHLFFALKNINIFAYNDLPENDPVLDPSSAVKC